MIRLDKFEENNMEVRHEKFEENRTQSYSFKEDVCQNQICESVDLMNFLNQNSVEELCFEDKGEDSDVEENNSFKDSFEGSQIVEVEECTDDEEIFQESFDEFQESCEDSCEDSFQESDMKYTPHSQDGSLKTGQKVNGMQEDIEDNNLVCKTETPVMVVLPTPKLLPASVEGSVSKGLKYRLNMLRKRCSKLVGCSGRSEKSSNRK